MKQSPHSNGRSWMFRALVTALALVAGSHAGYAQTDSVNKQTVAFVQTDRSQIFVVNPELKKIDTILKSTPPFLTCSKLAMLGSTTDASTYLIGGSFTYINPSSGTPVTYLGIIAIPESFKITDPNPLGEIKFLKTSNVSAGQFRPNAVISSDNREWFVTFEASAQGNPKLMFYHGNMDGTGNIDSVALDQSYQVQSGFRMSNLAITPDNTQMVTMICDQLLDGSATPKRMQLLNWSPKSSTNTNLQSHPTVGQQIKGFGPKNLFNTDSLNGIAIRCLDNENAEFAVADLSTNSLTFYKLPFNGSALNFNTPSSRNIPRSCIPSTENFFCGYFAGEVIAAAGQWGVGGDMNFNADGSMIAFDTHDAADDNTKDGAHSEIYTYDFSGGGATSLFNDVTKFELQPVFVNVKFPLPPKPKDRSILTFDTKSLNFGTIDTNNTKDLTIVLTNPTNDSDCTVSAITITGPGAAAFTAKPATPFTVAKAGGTQTVTVTFNAGVPPANTYIATMKIDFRGDTSTTIALTGKSHVAPPDGSVATASANELRMTINPNPFNEKSSIILTAVKAGEVGFSLRDALGRTVYSQSPLKVGAGEKLSYSLDATSLNLASGTYFVVATIDGKELVQQVVRVK